MEEQEEGEGEEVGVEKGAGGERVRMGEGEVIG